MGCASERRRRRRPSRASRATMPGMHALRPALERRRPPLERAHDAVLDGEVVLDDVELGDRARALGRREDHAIGAGHAQIAPTGVDDRGLGRGHARSSTATTPGAHPPPHRSCSPVFAGLAWINALERPRDSWQYLRTAPRGSEALRAEISESGGGGTKRFRPVPTLGALAHHLEKVAQSLAVDVDLDVVAQRGGRVVEADVDFAELGAEVRR